MPELPDVEVLKQYLDSTSLGQTIEKVEVRNPKILGNVSVQALRETLMARKFQTTRRHGKYLLVHLDDSSWLTLHFGMTGRLEYFKDIQKDPPYDRLLISFTNGFHLAYVCQRMLGEVGLAEDAESFIKEKNLGPDALELDFFTFKKILEGRMGAIKSTLMNQQRIAGIGNIYSEEILFQTGLHPNTTVNRLNEEMLQELFQGMKMVLQTTIDCQADADQLPISYLLLQRHREGKCPRCEGELKRIKISSRTAYCCPECQVRLL
jgi:formamidopyrimidine-DNA glycosylase